jgi:hypothetical protein
MKVYWGSGGIAPRILDLGTRWTWVVSLTPRPLYPQGKSPWYPLDGRRGGPQSRSGLGGVEKNSQPLSGLEPPIMQPVAQRYTTELSRLLLAHSWRLYECVSRSSQAESITKYMLTTINTRWEATQCVMAAKLTRLTQKIEIPFEVLAPGGQSGNFCIHPRVSYH